MKIYSTFNKHQLSKEEDKSDDGQQLKKNIIQLLCVTYNWKDEGVCGTLICPRGRLCRCHNPLDRFVFAYTLFCKTTLYENIEAEIFSEIFS